MSRSSRPEPADRPGHSPLDRRDFIVSAGGLLVSAAALPACAGEPNGPPPSGKSTLVARITGLNGAAAGGSATGQLATGGPTLTVPMPTPDAQGVSLGNLPGVDPGDYNVTYNPPSSHGFITGETATKPVTLVADGTETLVWACEPKGIVAVRATGLAGAGSGGSASAQLASGGPALPVPMPNPDGQGVALGNLPDVDPGVYNVTYTPPANYRLVQGEPATKQATVASAVTATTVFACEPTPTGGSAITGQVTLQGAGTGVPGGVVQALIGTTVVATIPVGAGGNFASATMAPGAYTLKLHPAGTHSLGDAEPDTKAVTVSTATPQTNFVVKAAMYYDNFQGYTSDANLRSTFPGGASTSPVDNNGQAPGSNVFLDATGGPTGGKAMRYNWPARPTSGCNNDITVKAAMRFNPAQGSATWFIRWREKMTNPWQNGSIASCPAGFWEYKHLLLHTPVSAGYEILMPQGKPGQNLFINLTMLDGAGHSTSNALQGNQLNLGLGTVWPGVWRVFVLGITGHGTATPRMDLYIDGVLAKSLTHPGVNYTFANANFGFMDIGANLDSGPDLPQSRWFSELGIYTTRPSLI